MNPLIEVKYQPERSRTYLGSPAVVRLPDGALVVSHDYYGKGCPRNHEAEESLTSIYRSEDDGASWVNVTHIMNCYWSSLFVHEGALYIFGVTQQYGSIVIRRSDDGGFTWTHPATPETGLLFAGGVHHASPSYVSSPAAVTVHEGRVYKAFEDCTPCVFGNFQALVVSAPVDADLLDAASWTMSNRVVFDPAFVPAAWGEALRPNWREGNIVADPDGALWDVMTFEAGLLEAEKAVRLRITDAGRTLSFDPASGFFDMPGSKAKFTLRRDPVSGMYISFGSVIDDLDILRGWYEQTGVAGHMARESMPRQRNKMFMVASPDLWTWHRVKQVIGDKSGYQPADSIRLTGFQYVDWQIDGDDIIFAVRTATRGSANFHDANRIEYGVVRDFRALIAAPLPPESGG